MFSDHSYSKSGNNHKLPPACTRCGRLFLDESSAKIHQKLLRSDPPCTLLTQEELQLHNAKPNRQGISEVRLLEIKTALRDFKAGLVPLNCDRLTFDRWVDKNALIYIGQSDQTIEVAKLEVGKWAIVYLTLFPDETLPPNPCK
jgi:hypothetical protein